MHATQQQLQHNDQQANQLFFLFCPVPCYHHYVHQSIDVWCCRYELMSVFLRAEKRTIIATLLHFNPVHFHAHAHRITEAQLNNQLQQQEPSPSFRTQSNETHESLKVKRKSFNAMFREQHNIKSAVDALTQEEVVAAAVGIATGKKIKWKKMCKKLCRKRATDVDKTQKVLHFVQVAWKFAAEFFACAQLSPLFSNTHPLMAFGFFSNALLPLNCHRTVAVVVTGLNIAALLHCYWYGNNCSSSSLMFPVNWTGDWTANCFWSWSM